MTEPPDDAPPARARVVRPAAYDVQDDDEPERPVVRRRRLAASRPPRRRERETESPEKPLPSYGELFIVMAIYAGMMSVSFSQVIFGLVFDMGRIAERDSGMKRQLIYDSLIFELIDAVIVVVGLICVGRPLAKNAAWLKLPTWGLSIPLFFVALAINFGYHALLVWLLKGDDVGAGEDTTSIGLKDGLWAILLVCVQPAVIEELFFRYTLLGHLRKHLGLHSSVWVSSVLFGMAHLGNIPGWPVLIFIGAGLGYARVLSGGLALPIALHFCHNFAVLLAEHYGH
jgi:uncharacterized protein